MTDIQLKFYSNKSNATRAAKAAKLTDFTIAKSGDGYKILVAAPAPARKAPKAKAVAPAKKAARKEPAPTGETKRAQLIAMCTRGANITELTETLGWLPHTCRGLLSRLGKAGYSVQRTKVGTDEEGFESHYKIAS